MYHQKDAIISGDEKYTFAEVYERACRLANGLRAQGAKPGDRIALLTPNCVHFLEFQIAVALSGWVQVPINAKSTTDEILEILQDSETRFLLCSPDFEESLVSNRDRWATVEGMWTLGKGGSYEALLRQASPREPDPIEDPGQRLYCLFYTSGTTGRPKAVMLSQDNWLAVAVSLLLEYTPLSRDDVILHLQPLTHGGGFFLLPAFARGALSVVTRKYDPEATWQLMERHGVTVLKLVPTMLVQIMEAGAGRSKPERLHTIVYGASPMAEEKLRLALQMFGPILVQLYGQAECPMSITVLTKRDHLRPERLRSAGRPCLLTEVRVFDDTDAEQPARGLGEVVVRGPQVMRGYWRNASLTSETLRNGWLHTRDIGYLDEEGYLFLVDRKDDMIISGGFNVYPREIEECLHRHPGVLEAVCVGLPDAVWGEIVAAMVVPRQGVSIHEQELDRFCRSVLPSHKRPRLLRVVAELPKNANGKISRKDAARLLQRHSEQAST